MVQYRKLERLDIRDKVQVDKYADTRVGGQFMLGGTFFNRLEVSAGYRFDRVRISGGTSPSRQDDARDLAGLRLHIRRDTLDEQEFPHTGMLLDLLAENKSHAVGSDFSYSSLQADLQRSFPLSAKSTVRVHLGATVSRGQVPFYERAYLGGYNFSELASRHFFGFKRDELVALQAGLAAASYQREIFSQPLSFVRRGFLLLHYNVAALSERNSRPYGFNVFHGAAVGFSLDTLLGPMRFAAGLAEGGRGQFYLSLGPSF
jgi:outer membrane protein assembly factor BamA